MKPSAWIVDIDGTLAKRGDRDPYDWRSVGEDQPCPAVVIATQALASHPVVDVIIAMSGRQESSRRQTELWLDAQQVPFDELFMRPTGDDRPDDELKQTIYEEHIAPLYSVIGILDDREKVVRMWRRLGLVCFQVAEGDF